MRIGHTYVAYPLAWGNRHGNGKGEQNIYGQSDRFQVDGDRYKEHGRNMGRWIIELSVWGVVYTERGSGAIMGELNTLADVRFVHCGCCETF